MSSDSQHYAFLQAVLHLEKRELATGEPSRKSVGPPQHVELHVSMDTSPAQLDEVRVEFDLL